MQGLSRGVLLVTVLMTAVVGQALPPEAAAQDTPVASPAAAQRDELAARTLAAATMDVLSPGTASLALGRIVVAPGAVVPLDATDPSASLLLMATGELTFRVEAPMRVVRKTGPGTAAPAQPEAIPANTAFAMREGDSALFPELTGGELRNDGTEEAMAWVASLVVLSPTLATPAP